MTASELIQEPFVAINGDDFYGYESFKIVANYYQGEGATFSMVAFQLDKTLSEFGGVTRGLCTVRTDLLDTVVETGDLMRTENGISSDREIELDGSEPVSMNVWGFTPDLFKHLKAMFIDFLDKEGGEMKSEYLIPTVVNNLIRSGQKQVHVLRTSSKWFGVTYKEDKPFVSQQIQELIDDDTYPKKLF